VSCFETPSVMYVGSGLSTFILPNKLDSVRRLFGKTETPGRGAMGREAYTALFLTLFSVRASHSFHSLCTGYQSIRDGRQEFELRVHTVGYR
jgi:hypothetical protein